MSRTIDFADGFSSATAPTGSGGGVTDHTMLTNIGTNTHAQIDSHIASTSNPHSVTKTQVGLSNVPNVDTTTTANITDSTNKRFVTDAEKTVIGNTSGVNTGDKTFDQLSPMTTVGDMIRGGASGAATRLPIGTSGQFLTVSGGIPAWTTVNPGAPQIAIIRDEKTSGTDGGASTAGSFQQRNLNTLVDPSGIVTSLTSNQFVLPAGTYYFDISVPSFNSDRFQAVLRNVTDSTNAIVGTSEIAATGTIVTRGVVKGIVTIASSKTFEVQHRVTTSNSLGWGIANNFGTTEVYTTVTIIKL